MPSIGCCVTTVYRTDAIDLYKRYDNSIQWSRLCSFLNLYINDSVGISYVENRQARDNCSSIPGHSYINLSTRSHTTPFRILCLKVTTHVLR